MCSGHKPHHIILYLIITQQQITIGWSNKVGRVVFYRKITFQVKRSKVKVTKSQTHEVREDHKSTTNGHTGCKPGVNTDSVKYNKLYYQGHDILSRSQ